MASDREAKLVKLLERAVGIADGLGQSACFVCGAEPGCNIDCPSCLWLTDARAALAAPSRNDGSEPIAAGTGDRPQPIEREGLATRLKLHAYELVNGGANASQLRNDLNAAAEALAAPPSAQEGWQPIETAPKIDNRLVLLFPSRCWSEDVNCDAEVGFWDSDDSEWRGFGPKSEDYTGPTHWMPLPPPPAGAPK